MTLHTRQYLLIARVRFLSKQADDSHNQARRAITALERPFVGKGLLHWMKGAAFGQTLDGKDFVSVRAGYGSHAGWHALAIEQDGTCAALTLTATVLGSRQLKLLPQYVEQGPVGICDDAPALAVHGEVERLVHSFRVISGLVERPAWPAIRSSESRMQKVLLR